MTGYLTTIGALLALLICCLLYIARLMDVSSRLVLVINDMRCHISPSRFHMIWRNRQK